MAAERKNETPKAKILPFTKEDWDDWIASQQKPNLTEKPIETPETQIEENPKEITEKPTLTTEEKAKRAEENMRLLQQTIIDQGGPSHLLGNDRFGGHGDAKATQGISLGNTFGDIQHEKSKKKTRKGF